MRTLFPRAVLLLLFATLTRCADEAPQPPVARAPRWPRITVVEPMPVPTGNPVTRAKVELGRDLFSDPRLSGDGTTSCAGCHDSKYGFTIGAAVPVAAYGLQINRACPSLMNVAYQRGYFWENVPMPLEDAIHSMWTFTLVPKGEGRPTVKDVAVRLDSDAKLRAQFVEAFGRRPDPEDVVKALASYLRTLVPGDAKWIRFFGGDSAALSEKARLGFEIFDRKALCSNCHSGILLTDRLNHDIGLGGAYKTPTLLNIGVSAPYFHDNSVPTLEAAVDRMLEGGFESARRDPQLRPVQLTAEERDQLLAFLRELDANPASID